MPEQLISYEDLLSGDLVYVEHVGHLRSPKLREMRPTEGVGWSLYRTYLFYMKQGKEDLEHLLQAEFPDFTVYDIITSLEALRSLVQDALTFFMSECVMWDAENAVFVSIRILPDGNEEIVGVINRENFDDVRARILTLNYISLKDADVNTKFASPEAEEAWNRIQKYIQESQKKQAEQEDETVSFGNLLSKLCAIHPSYNYLNVFELTIFQFYDAFFQCSYLRQTGFVESCVSNHGSERFDYEDWLKPVKNY